MDADGNLVIDGHGQPIAFHMPLIVHSLTRNKDGAARLNFRHTDQQLSPKEVAALAGVDLSTVKACCQ